MKSCPKKSSLRIITSANYQNDLRKKEQCDIYEEATALTRKKKCEIFFRETNTTSLPFRVLMYKMKNSLAAESVRLRKIITKSSRKKMCFVNLFRDVKKFSRIDFT